MKCKLLFCFSLAASIAICSCNNEPNAFPEPIRIAFLADVHLQDIYAKYTDANYQGIKDPVTGSHYTIRTMGAQLRSTRLFNENYFAFKAALDHIVSENIKIVVLPGDFSDDGQMVNIRALKNILDDYTTNHGIQFLLTTGNHDPVRPFTRAAGKNDFLGEHGKQQAIVSDSSLLRSNSDYELQPIVSKEIAQLGYTEILTELSNFGFSAKEDFLYWETPFSNYSYDDYSYTRAIEASDISQRRFPIGTKKDSLPDASYLVEPLKDIWLLGIDANIYVPKEGYTKIGEKPNRFSSASIGYNNMFEHKKHLVPWIKKVSMEAKKRGKTLVAFSHYPMVEFYDNATWEIEQLFSQNTMQMHRVPKDTIAELFADFGIQLHFGGHMHLNDTGIHKAKSGKTLFNIQTPTLAGYIPAFKILTINSAEEMIVKTVMLDSVPNFNALFPLYREEHKHLRNKADSDVWDNQILGAKSYSDFTESHLMELVRLRFLPNDWPIKFGARLEKTTGIDLLKLGLGSNGPKAINKDSILGKIDLKAFGEWTGRDMIFDFYKLRNAGELARYDIDSQKWAQYELVCTYLRESDDLEMSLWGAIFYKAMHGHPSENFKINLKMNTIERL